MSTSEALLAAQAAIEIYRLERMEDFMHLPPEFTDSLSRTLKTQGRLALEFIALGSLEDRLRDAVQYGRLYLVAFEEQYPDTMEEDVTWRDDLDKLESFVISGQVDAAMDHLRSMYWDHHDLPAKLDAESMFWLDQRKVIDSTVDL